MTKFVACAACVGPIRESLGALNKLEELSLSGNMLTGEKESNGLMLLLLEDVPLPCIPGTRSHNVFSRSTEIADATAFQALTHVGSILNELGALTKIGMLIRASKRHGMRLLNASPLGCITCVASQAWELFLNPMLVSFWLIPSPGYATEPSTSLYLRIWAI